MEEQTEEIQKALRAKKRRPKIKISAKNGLSTGSTLLNLAISGNEHYGFFKGGYFLFVGDSSSGKTFLTLTCLAEAALQPRFNSYRLIHDDVENGAIMDKNYFFGSKAAKRIEAPATYEDGAPAFSENVEDFYYNLDDLLTEAENGGAPFIYILDSENGLGSKSEDSKFDEQKKAALKGTETAGSYGDGKAKIHSQNLRKITQRLRNTGSILIIISQTRDNIGFGFEKKTRSGGKALKFYAHLELWASVKGKIPRTVRGKTRTVGMNALVKSKKNRVAGKNHEVLVPMYYTVGIDDIGSCIDYLISEKHWAKVKQTVKAKDFDFEGSREKLIQHIEENDLETDLRSLVGDIWKEIEESCVVHRKRRYQ